MSNYHYAEGSFTRPGLDGEIYANFVQQTRSQLRSVWSKQGVSDKIVVKGGNNAVLATETENAPMTTAGLKSAWKNAGGKPFETQIGDLSLTVNPQNGNIAFSSSAYSLESKSYAATRSFMDAFAHSKALRDTIVNPQTNGDMTSGIYYHDMASNHPEATLYIQGGNLKVVGSGLSLEG